MKQLLTSVLFLTSCWCFSVSTVAQDFRIAVIQTVKLPIVVNSTAAFEKELAVIMPEAKFTFDIYDAKGSLAEANRAIAQICQQSTPPDLIVSVATLATRALYNAEALVEVPKLFMTVADPIKEGIVPEFNTRSSNNITGESHVLDAKVKLDLLEGLLKPSFKGRAFSIALVHTDYPSSSGLVAQLLELDDNYDSINFVPVGADYVEGEAGLAAMSEDIISLLKAPGTQFDGYWLSTGPLQESDRIIDDIRQSTQLMPLFAENLASVKRGALLGVVSGEQSIGQSAATRARLILNGQAANAIAVSRTEQYNVAVNVSTAIKMNIPIPSSYLKLAKNNIYQ